MNKERERMILESLLANKSVTVKKLAADLYASEPSIRRDLASLEKQNLLRRVHGGAVLLESALSELKIPFAIRELEQSDAKIIMARKAIDLVHDHDVIFLDASSSAYTLIPFLATRKNITVITSGVKTLTKLAEYHINAISTGGRLLNSCMSLVGEEAYGVIDNFTADIVFFSCRGLSADGKLTDISDGEDLVRRRMIKNAKKSYLLCAGEKIGKTYYHNLCTAGDITGIISEGEWPAGAFGCGVI